MGKLHQFLRVSQASCRAYSTNVLFSRVVPRLGHPTLTGITVDGPGTTKVRSALPEKFSSLGIVLGLLLAAVSGAQANLTVDLSTNRGSETVDGTSVGAFTANSTEFDFTGLQWIGDASATLILNDLAQPGVLSSPVTLNYPPLDQPPMTATLAVGGAYYVQNSLSGGAPGPTQVAPLFFTEMVQTSTATFTPSGSTTKFSGTNTGTVAGGGTYSLTISGILFGSDYTTPDAASLRGRIDNQSCDA